MNITIVVHYTVFPGHPMSTIEEIIEEVKGKMPTLSVLGHYSEEEQVSSMSINLKNKEATKEITKLVTLYIEGQI